MTNRIDDILALIDSTLDEIEHNRYDYDDECRLEDDEEEAFDV